MVNHKDSKNRRRSRERKIEKSNIRTWHRLAMHKLAIYDLGRILPSGPEKQNLKKASSLEEEAQLQAVHGLFEMVDDDDIGHKKLN